MLELSKVIVPSKNTKLSATMYPLEPSVTVPEAPKVIVELVASSLLFIVILPPYNEISPAMVEEFPIIISPVLSV